MNQRELILAGLVIAALALISVLAANAETEETGKYPEAHVVGKCDKQGTKKTAHLLSSHNLHKKLDNDLVLGFVEYCCKTRSITSLDGVRTEEKECDPQCVVSIRQSEEAQRERTGEKLQNGLTGLTVLFMGIKALGGL